MNTPEHLGLRLPPAGATSPSLPAPPALASARVPGVPHAGPEITPAGVPVSPAGLAAFEADPLTAWVTAVARALHAPTSPTPPALADAPAAPAAPKTATAAPPSNPFAVTPAWDALLAAVAAPTPPAPTLVPLVDAERRPDAPPNFAPATAPTPAPGPALAPAHAHDPDIGVTLPAAPGPFDAVALRREFPVLEERVHGRRLVWLDNAATTQKPRAVIDRLTHYYEHENSNIHRAAHTLAARATDAYEAARESTRRFIGAGSASEIVFVRGATEGINLVAQAWGGRNVGAGDEIVVTWLEHHANIVPWQRLAREKGATLKVAPVDDRGQIDLEAYARLLGPRTRIVALTQVSNALGTITPSKAMIDLAHLHGATVLLDGAQAVSHLRVDVRALDCDFFVFSGHKVYGPTGIGAVYGKAALLETMPPWQAGGNMIQDVTFERTVYQPPPMRFEAGTGNIADAVGLGAALDWLSRLGLEAVAAHEHDLLHYATERVRDIPGLTIVGTAPEKTGVLSFVIDGHDTHAVGKFLDGEGIAVRGGHHCAQPILRRFGHESTVRASFAAYNGRDDVDALVCALERLTGRRG